MKVANVANEQVVASLPMKALNAQAAADIILDGVIRDKDVIIFPSNVKWAWRLHRWFPRLLDKAWLEKIRSLRRLRRESEGAAKG